MLKIWVSMLNFNVKGSEERTFDWNFNGIFYLTFLSEQIFDLQSYAPKGYGATLQKDYGATLQRATELRSKGLRSYAPKG